MHKFLFYSKFIICLYMFRALCAHHQENKIVLYSIWYRQTCRWPSGAQVERECRKSCFIVSLLYASTCFKHYVLINRRSKLYYTASGIVTLCRWPSRAPVHGTATYRSDYTSCCIIQFRPPDDEHIVLETCRGI